MIQEKGQFGKFLIELYDLWTKDPNEHLLERITPLDNIMAACSKHLGQREEARKCFHCQDQIFAVNPEGMVFPSCNKFLAHPDTCFGSLNDNSFEEILESDARKAFLAKVEEPKNVVCKDCNYNSICQGGCFFLAYAHKLDQYQDREDLCKGYYFVFDHIVKDLSKDNVFERGNKIIENSVAVDFPSEAFQNMTRKRSEEETNNRFSKTDGK